MKALATKQREALERRMAAYTEENLPSCYRNCLVGNQMILRFPAPVASARLRTAVEMRPLGLPPILEPRPISTTRKTAGNRTMSAIQLQRWVEARLRQAHAHEQTGIALCPMPCSFP